MRSSRTTDLENKWGTGVDKNSSRFFMEPGEENCWGSSAWARATIIARQFWVRGEERRSDRNEKGRPVVKQRDLCTEKGAG